jgi:hypothetical protein
MQEVLALVHSLNIWALIAAVFLLAYRARLTRLFEALTRRVERGDELRISTWLTLGTSAGPLKTPALEGLVTDDHIAVIHRSWRVPDRDKDFGGQEMHQIHVILFGEPAALDRIEYVLYRLDPTYPNPTRASSDRKNAFELKELANGYSLIRAEVKIKDQSELIYLSRFIDLTPTSPHLRGTYL